MKSTQLPLPSKEDYLYLVDEEDQEVTIYSDPEDRILGFSHSVQDGDYTNFYTVHCTLLSETEVKKLRDFLNEKYPKSNT